MERYLLIQYIKYLYTKREDDKNQVSALIQEYNKNGFDSLLMFIMGTQVHERYQVLQWLAEDVKKKLDQGSPMCLSVLTFDAMLRQRPFPSDGIR